jgi:hypothetical protein
MEITAQEPPPELLPVHAPMKHVVELTQLLKAATAVTQFAPSCCAQTPKLLSPEPMAQLQAMTLGHCPPL